MALLSCEALLLMLLLLLLKTVQSQRSTCANSYDLRVNTGDSCVYSSQDNYTLCNTDLTTYLENFNTLLDSSNCLNLTLAAGEYKLSKGVTVTYSIFISSTVYQNVVISCSAVDYSSLSFTSDLSARGQVLLDGIVFKGCNKPLQFDELEFVSMENCSFR